MLTFSIDCTEAKEKIARFALELNGAEMTLEEYLQTQVLEVAFQRLADVGAAKLVTENEDTLAALIPAKTAELKLVK